MEKTKRIYRCKECLGKTCLVSMVMNKDIAFDYQTIACPKNNPSKSWTWISSISPDTKTKE